MYSNLIHLLTKSNTKIIQQSTDKSNKNRIVQYADQNSIYKAAQKYGSEHNVPATTKISKQYFEVSNKENTLHQERNPETDDIESDTFE